MKLTLKAFSVGVFVAISVAAQAQIVSIRIEGEGYFRFLREGRAVYAKSAALTILNGELQEKSGVSFLPPIRLPSGVNGFRVAEDGWVTGVTATGETKVVRLMLARFEANGGLEQIGDFWTARDRATLGFAGQEGFGKILQPRSTPTISKPNHRPAVSQKNSSGMVRIVLPVSATVNGPKFTLGEVAEIQGQGAELAKTLDLGTAPVHGVPMLYSRERILARLTAIGLEKAELSMGTTIEIRRAGQAVTADQLIERAKAAVEAKLGLKGELACSDKLADIQVPNGALEIAVEMISTLSGSASVTLGIRVDGKRVIGRTLRLSGAILEPAVQAGSSVTVRFVSNGVVIEIAGRVRSSAAIGQTVEVTVNSGEGSGISTHQGTVIAPGKVEVKL